MDIFWPIQQLADGISYRWLKLPVDSYWGAALNFFVYDLIKIGVLLLLINFVMAATRYYFPLEKVRNVLLQKRWYGFDYVLAALLGVVTPFCSCSSIPLFIGFVGSGIPVGVTFAFLISSPLVNESSLYLFPALFGWPVTILYNLMGISVAILGGWTIEKLGGAKYIRSELLRLALPQQRQIQHPAQQVSLQARLRLFGHDGLAITKTVFPYVVIGVGLGALIHGFVPASLVEQYVTNPTWWAVPVATLMGAPLYANSLGVIPIMEAMVGKGVPLGTALAFMTAIVTVSIPESLMLYKVMKWPLLVMFFGITIFGIMLIGYGFNWLGF